MERDRHIVDRLCKVNPRRFLSRIVRARDKFATPAKFACAASPTKGMVGAQIGAVWPALKAQYPRTANGLL